MIGVSLPQAHRPMSGPAALARFTADYKIDGAVLELAVVRSPHDHARIIVPRFFGRREAMPGVIGLHDREGHQEAPTGSSIWWTTSP